MSFELPGIETSIDTNSAEPKNGEAKNGKMPSESGTTLNLAPFLRTGFFGREGKDAGVH